MAEPDGIRREDARLLRGEGRYTDDLVPEGALHAVFVRSPFAHARIAGIETAAARQMPGVVRVMTAADVAGLGSIRPVILRQAPGGGPMQVPPRPPLTGDVGRYVGDPIALVVAETRAAAEDSAEAVGIDWEEADAVTDLEAAVAEGAPQVWPEVPGNVAFAWAGGDGDATAAALADAAHVTRARVRVTRTTAAPMEPRAATASHGGGQYRLVTGLQAPWQARAVLAGVLGVAPEAVECISPDVGGSFGMKGQTFPEYGALLAAAEKCGRPVHWRASRSEALLTDDQGRDMALTGWLGLDADGRITALKVEGLTALGAYLSTRGPLTAVDNLPGVCGPYRVPVAHGALKGVYSHTPSLSPYRGAGRPEASLLIERLMDIAARETGRDPVELRRLNLLRPEELPWESPLGFSYDTGEFEAVLDEVLALGDYAGFPARREEATARGRLRGFGLASVIARSAAGQFESARVTLAPDGQATLASGAVSQGQGHASVLPDLAAATLGLDADAMTYETGASALFDAAVGSFGSRTSGIGASAVVRAAEALAEALKPEAARALNAGADEIKFSDGRFTAGGRTITVAELAPRLAAPVAAEARYAPEAATYPNSAQTCEIEIDPETGQLEVVRYACVEDVGRVLHPTIVKGQVHGGIAQGLAQVMNERIAWDASGQPLTGSFMDFAVPRASDLPLFDVAAHPVPTPRNPLGTKGAGEGGTIGALPAFQNALADALGGLDEVPMPATAEAVWRAIETKREAT